MNPTPLSRFSLDGFKQHNALIYGVLNDRNNFTPPEMILRMQWYQGHVSKAARKNKKDHLSYALCMLFSWSMALSNRLHIEVEEEMLKCFPGVCPYCVERRCACRSQGDNRAIDRAKGLSFPSTFEKPETLWQLQSMLATIYHENTLLDSAIHLGEELAEIGGAAHFFFGVHDPKLFDRIVEELMDVIANILAVATCAGFNLAVEMERIYTNGCPTCHGIPCTDCGFSISTLPRIR